MREQREKVEKKVLGMIEAAETAYDIDLLSSAYQRIVSTFIAVAYEEGKGAE